MKLTGMFVLVCSICQVASITLQIRQAYFKAALDRSAFVELKRLLEAVRDSSPPLLGCYKGAAEMLDARYCVNPLNKMGSFMKGKKLIERSIARDSTSIECRFIRFTIQRNLPGFLSYSQNVKQDSALIANSLPLLKDQDLKDRIYNYFERLRAGSK